MFRKLLPVALLCGAPAIAQPTLTGANVNPSPGMSVTYYNTTLGAPGASGANVTWNFASLPNNGSSTADYVACSAAPDCATMTGTTVVTSQPSGYGYFIADANRFSIRGLNAGGVVFDYSDPEDYTHFPFTYNDNFTDNFTSTFTSGATFTRSGNVNVTADGYGTLILPTGTFNNVLRIHSVENYTDSWMGMTMFTYVGDGYMWYQPGNHEIILSTATTTTDGTQSTTIDFYTGLTPAAVNDVNELQASLKTYPNPSSGILNVDLKLTTGAEVSINLTDITGKIVAGSGSKSYTSGAHTETISTAALAPGIYMLQVATTDNRITRKIEVL